MEVTISEQRPPAATNQSMQLWPGSKRPGNGFDLANKKAVRAQIEQEMAQPGFWDNPEKAQSVVAQLSAVKSLIDPAEDAIQKANDLAEFFELAEQENKRTGYHQEIENLQVVIVDIKTNKESLSATLEELETEKEDLGQRINSSRAQMTSVEKEIDEIKEGLHDQEMEDQDDEEHDDIDEFE